MEVVVVVLFQTRWRRRIKAAIGLPWFTGRTAGKTVCVCDYDVDAGVDGGCLCLWQSLEADIESKSAAVTSLLALCQLVVSEQSSCHVTADVADLQRSVDQLDRHWHSLQDKAAHRRQLYVWHLILNAVVSCCDNLELNWCRCLSTLPYCSTTVVFFCTIN